jgi:hypothetical protein
LARIALLARLLRRRSQTIERVCSLLLSTAEDDPGLIASLARLARRGSRWEAAAFLTRSQTKNVSARSLVQDGGARSGNRSHLLKMVGLILHLSALSRVAQRPYSCMAVTSRSIASRLPLETIAFPVV